MGTVVGIDVRDPNVRDAIVDEAFERLRAIDARFSTFRTDSEVSRYGRGEVADDDLSDELREVLGLCEAIRVQSDGVFDIRRHRADGVVDPSGLVKGWAVEEAVAILLRAGAPELRGQRRRRHRRSRRTGPGAGMASRHPAPGDRARRWRPSSRSATWPSRRRARTNAASTSSTPAAARRRPDLLSATVVGPSLTFADAYATVAFAMGIEGISWVASLPGYEGCVITRDHRFIWTDGFEPLLVRTGVEDPTKREPAGATAVDPAAQDPDRAAP